MFPSRVKYTESEYDIQNKSLLYKIDHRFQNTLQILYKFKKKMFCNVYKLHYSYFVIFVNLCIFGNFCIFYIFYPVVARQYGWFYCKTRGARLATA